MAESGLAGSIKATVRKEESSGYGYITETMFDAAMINLTESNSYEERDTDDDEYGYNSQKGENDAKNVTSEEDTSVANKEQELQPAESESENFERGQEKDSCSLEIVESEETDQVEKPEDTNFVNIVKEEHPTAAEIQSCEASKENMEESLIIPVVHSTFIKEEMVDECDISDHQNASFSEEMEIDLMERLEYDDVEEKECAEQERKTVTSKHAENIVPVPKPSSSSSSFLLEMLKQPVINSNKANSSAYEKDLPSFANVPSVRESVAGICRTDNGKMRVTDENGFTTDIEIITESDSEAAAGIGSKSLGMKSVAVCNDDEVTLERCSPTGSCGEKKGADDKPDTADIDELLQLTVPKDYVNCVWSNDSEANEITEVISTSTPCSSKNSDPVNVQNAMNNSSESMIEAVEEDVRSDDPQTLTNSSETIKHVSNTIPSDLCNKISSASEKWRNKDLLSPEAEMDSSQNALEVPMPHINVWNGDRVKNPKKSRQRMWPQTSHKGKGKGRGMIQIESIRSLASDTPAASNDQLGCVEEKTELCASTKTAVSTVQTIQPIDTPYTFKSKQMNYTPHLQAAFRKMVLNHALPPYSPTLFDAKHWNGAFHTCTACGDKFVLESSLENHLSRHSAIFTYMCPKCSSRSVFYNRCTLLQHLIMHGMKPDSIEAAHLSIFPLSDVGGEVSSPAKIICVECKKEVISLASHMEGKDSSHKSGIATTCKICNQILPSTCALIAHDRIHKQKPPHVCPECGLVFPVWESLQIHIQEICCLVNRKTTYQCMSCSVVYFSTQKLIEHIIGKHFKEIYKCDACYIACFSVESLGVHRKNHKELPVLESDELQKQVEKCGYYTCQLCPNQLIRRDSKLQHAISHAKDHTIMSSIYQCDKCDKIFSTRELLLEHNHRCKTYTKKRHRESATNQSKQLITPTLASEIPGSLEAPAPPLSQHGVSAPPDESPLSSTLSVGSIPSIFDGYLDVNEIAPSKPLIWEKLPGDMETKVMEENKIVETGETKTEVPQTNGRVETDRHCILCNGPLDMGKPFNMNTKSFLANYCRPCWSKLRLNKAMNNNSETSEETAKVAVEKKSDKIVPEKKDKACNKKEKRQSGQSEKKHPENSKMGGKNVLLKEVKKKIQPGTESYICKLCKRLISKDCDKTAIKNHFIEEHRDIFLKALQTGQSAATGTDKKVSYKLPIQKLIVDNPSGLPKNSPFRKSMSPKKRKQHVSEEAHSMDSENYGVGTPGQSPSKKSRRKSSSMSDTSPLRVGQTLVTSEDQMNTHTNLCYKCGFSNDCNEAFRDHIVTHKADPSSLQCPVCGMCFIVRPPLEKHLLVHHGIKNVKECLRINGFDEPHTEEEISKKTSPETEDILEANRCKVCREKFDNALLLEKHFRVHGGAFLLANQKARKL